MLLVFSKFRISKLLGLVNAFWIRLNRNIDLLDSHLDSLDRDIPNKILFVSKTSWRRLQDMSSRHLEDVFKTSSRCLQRNNFSSSKTSWRCLQDVFKTSWKTKNWYAEDVLKTSSRHVLNTSSWRLEDQQMFAR